MKIKAKLLNLSAFGVFSVLLCGFQTSFVSHFNSTLTVSFWLLPLIYIVPYREFSTAIVFVYAVGFCASFFSASSAGTIWLCLLLASSTLNYIKAKIFYDTSKYFLISCGLFVFFMALGALTLDLVARVSSSQLNYLSYLSDALCLMLLSKVFFFVFKKIDLWLPYDPFLNDSKGGLLT